MPDFRALSVRQPWAWAIVTQGKDVENRSRATAYRGMIAIHASLTIDEGHLPTRTPEGRAAAQALDAMGGRGNWWNPAHHVPSRMHESPPAGLAVGAIVGVATLIGCHNEATESPRNSCSPWGQPDQYHWWLANAQPLAEPVPCRGALGLWRLPEDVEKAVREQLEVRQ